MSARMNYNQPSDRGRFIAGMPNVVYQDSIPQPRKYFLNSHVLIEITQQKEKTIVLHGQLTSPEYAKDPFYNSDSEEEGTTVILKTN